MIERLIFAAIGGACIVYGIVQRGKMKKRQGTPYVDPDPLARQAGNVALGFGVLMLLAALLS